MNLRMLKLIAGLLLINEAVAEEPLNVAGQYNQIAADYQRIAAATQNQVARAAAGRLTRDAYRHLLQRAEGVEKFSADDLHALGQCHEAIGETDKARDLYSRSLAAAPAARTRLSLARMNLGEDLKLANTHFAEAVKLDPEHPDLSNFRLSLAAAYQHERDWDGAIPYLEQLLGYTKTLSERSPASAQLRISHDSVQKQLDRVRRFSGMTGNTAPALRVTHWAQGEASELVELKGKVVLVDFCAIWAQPSRERIELLKDLRQDGVEIIGVTLPYKHKYDAEADTINVAEDLAPADEATGFAAFARKHEIPWRLALIGPETISEYGVASLPHTVAIDKAGNVNAILFGGDKAAEDLKAIIAGLLK